MFKTFEGYCFKLIFPVCEKKSWHHPYAPVIVLNNKNGGWAQSSIYNNLYSPNLGVGTSGVYIDANEIIN